MAQVKELSKVKRGSISFQQMGKELTSEVLPLVIGVGVASLGVQQINKATETIQGIGATGKQAIVIGTPALILVGSIVARQYVKEPFLKTALLGTAVYGGLSLTNNLVSNVMKIDILSGFKGLGNSLLPYQEANNIYIPETTPSNELSGVSV